MKIGQTMYNQQSGQASSENSSQENQENQEEKKNWGLIIIYLIN